MKHVITLIVVLLLILLTTQVEDYLSKTDLGRVTMQKDQIDYYLVDFSIMAVEADGNISYELSGQHLSHWQGKRQSRIIAPEINTSAGFKLQSDHLLYDQTTREISTDADVFITAPNGTMQSTGLTAKLDDNLLRFDSNVRSTYQVK
ncbi:MAG: LPS export ABC transporter periplasmic protein LptC [Candidatus Thiothrix putei]|uniref:Lipopolysaccharide export system protein LptC n=2 Tax=Thiothrix TaxID=1030 RepID=A0A1H4EGF7_9GAMM|nr:LPS export ABC transporter periplasmic protein LptC [Thiothrix caldifontis]WGZ95797.1 MAG: LPS export ABC transporter periplasmic protein LptC [Candidatus Thiothrix putei]SEA83937.1 Lipopolysaccharide export system protein LptC [Thiothrix caldifontis]